MTLDLQVGIIHSFAVAVVGVIVHLRKVFRAEGIFEHRFIFQSVRTTSLSKKPWRDVTRMITNKQGVPPSYGSIYKTMVDQSTYIRDS